MRISCSPAVPSDVIPLTSVTSMVGLANITSPLAVVPRDFNIELQFELSTSFPPEACFFNIIAALREAALGFFAGKMPVANFRTSRYPQPEIKIFSADMADIPRSFVVWGLFLVAFTLNVHNVFKLSFYSLQWKGRDEAGIGVGGFKLPRENPNMPTTLTAVPFNRELAIVYDYFGGAVNFGKGAVFMTIISSIMEAAPRGADIRIQETIINYLQNEPCAFVVTPTAAARTAVAPFFMYRDLIDALTNAAEFFVLHNKYQQVEMNISTNGVLIAQAAFVKRTRDGILNYTSSGEQGVSTFR